MVKIEGYFFQLSILIINYNCIRSNIVDIAPNLDPQFIMNCMSMKCQWYMLRRISWLSCC